MAIHSGIFWPGKSHGQRSLAGYSPQGHKEWDTTEHLNNDKSHNFAFVPGCLMSHAVLSHVSIILGQFHRGYLQDAYTYNTISFTEPPLDRSLAGEQESYRTLQRIAKRLCAFSALPAAPRRAAVLVVLDLSSREPGPPLSYYFPAIT